MKTFIVLLIIIFFCSGLFSQTDNYICYTDENISAGYLQLPTNSVESDQYLRMLIIYVTFPDDNFDGPSNTYENIWPRPDTAVNGTRPLNPYTTDKKLIDSLEKSDTIPFMNRYREYTYSDWFCEMSQGKLDVIGDEIYFRLPQNSSYYQNSLNWRRNELNKWILRYVQNTLNVDFSRYDNWTYSNGEWSWGSDGIAEMVAIQFRRIPGSYESYYWNIGIGGVGGEASLGIDSTLLLDNTYVGSGNGITATQGINRVTRVMLVVEHEISHHIFGSYFNHLGFNFSHTSIGLMTEGHGNSTYTMLPMERSMTGLNWSIPDTVNSGNVQSSYTLDDFISSGECLKVEIPNTNPKEFFWISNHQKVSKYDGVSRGSHSCWQTNKYEQDPYCGEGIGLYIFHESPRNCNNNVNGYNLIHGNRHFAFDLINSEGRYNWALDRTVSDPYLGSFGIQKNLNGNRDSGVYEFYKYYLQTYPTWSAQLITDDFCSSASNDYFITGDFHGDGLDGYNIGYDEIFSPYSNPTTRSCQDLSNNGLTIVLQSQDSYGAITLKIYYNDEDALIDLPPSKPKNLKVGKQYFGEPESYKFYPVVTWDSNIEPDFYDAPAVSPLLITPVYEIYRADTTVCDIEPVYSLITTVSSTTTQYVDSNVTLYDNIPAIPDYCEYTLLTYSYKILAKDNRGNRSLKSERGLLTGYNQECGPETEDLIESENNILPDMFSITNYPNPFNPTTNIKFDLPKDVLVSIKIFDMLGREIRTLVNDYKTAGSYTISFNGSDLSSGIYYFKIKAEDFEQVRKMMLLK